MQNRTTSLLLLIAAITVTTVGLGACASGGGKTDVVTADIDPSKFSRKDTDKLLVVDCLLPPRVKKLGSTMKYLESSRPIKTSAIECEIRGGEYVAYDRADYRTALRVWLGQAELGEPRAQTYVGEIYERGLGTAPNYVLASQWYYKAAEQDYAAAQINLGYLYEKGLGVQQDLVEAMNWYRKGSGLSEELGFVSSVAISDTSVGEEELEVLRGEITRLREQADQSRSDLNATQRKLDRARLENNILEQETKRLRQLKAQLDQEPSLAETLDLDRRTIEEQLRGREAELAQRRSEVSQLTAQTKQYRKKVDKLESAQQLAVSGPRIELIEPPLSPTRARLSVRLRSPTEQTKIVGRILAPAGLLTFNVNNRFEKVDKDNNFQVWVPVGQAETPVTLVAIDKKGRRTQLDFTITTPEVASVPATSSSEPVLKKTGEVDFGAYHALIIGNDDYTFLPTLKTAVNDARDLEQILRARYGFQTTLLLNADRHAILSTLHQLRERLTQRDNLLIYYAGHGDLDRINDRGYWLPLDAELGNPANWISNIAITDLLNAMNARHIMVIADSCYSGAMSRTAVARVDVNMPEKLRQKWLSLMAKSRSRTVLTSGGLQPVLDEGGGTNSLFARALLTALSNNQDIIEGYSLFRQITDVVAERAEQVGVEQVPEYAPIKHAGHETGQFFFIPSA